MRPRIEIVEVQEATAFQSRRVTLQVSYRNKTAILQIDPTDKEVISSAEKAYKQNEAAYDIARTHLTNSLTQLSEAKDAVARTGDIAAAMSVAIQMRQDVRQRLATASATKTEVERVVVQAELELEIEEKADSLASSLAALVEHGE